MVYPCTGEKGICKILFSILWWLRIALRMGRLCTSTSQIHYPCPMKLHGVQNIHCSSILFQGSRRQAKPGEGKRRKTVGMVRELEKRRQAGWGSLALKCPFSTAKHALIHPATVLPGLPGIENGDRLWWSCASSWLSTWMAPFSRFSCFPFCSSLPLVEWISLWR